MKKIHIALLAAALSATLFTGCSQPKEPVELEPFDFLLTQMEMEDRINALGEITDASKISEIYELNALYKMMDDKEAEAVGNLGYLRTALEKSASFLDAEDLKISVMSFNVRTGETYPYRMESVATLIRNESPDTFGVQEAQGEWTMFLREKLGDEYAMVGHGRDERSQDETTNVFYKKDKFELLGHDTIWLTDTPEFYSCYFDPVENEYDTPRIMTYAILKRKSDGAVFIHANTHLAASTSASRQYQANCMINYLEETFDFDYPIVLTGDFNAGKETPEYAIIADAGFTPTDTYGEQKRTFQGYTDDWAGTFIDFCFVNDYIPILSYKVCDEKMNGEWISDHNAIVSEILILPEITTETIED